MFDRIKDQQIEKKALNRAHVFMILEAIELFHIADETFQIKEIAKNKVFMDEYLFSGLCDFETKGANALSINIYGAIMK